jgi:hypothetical protein
MACMSYASNTRLVKTSGPSWRLLDASNKRTCKRCYWRELIQVLHGCGVVTCTPCCQVLRCSPDSGPCTLSTRLAIDKMCSRI